MITQELLKEFLHYEPETGVFTWKERHINRFSSERSCKSWNTQFPGRQAGSYHCDGYITIGIQGKLYLAHRLAWLYIHGCFPDEIDHINGKRDGNKICNLRDVSHQENGKNTKKPNNNTSGCMGLHWRASLNKWQAQIKYKQRNIHLGVFDDWFEAICARKSAENRYGFHVNHGRIQ